MYKAKSHKFWNTIYLVTKNTQIDIETLLTTKLLGLKIIELLREQSHIAGFFVFLDKVLFVILIKPLSGQKSLIEFFFAKWGFISTIMDINELLLTKQAFDEKSMNQSKNNERNDWS